MKNLFENFRPKKVCNPNKFCVPKKDLGPNILDSSKKKGLSLKNVWSKRFGCNKILGSNKFAVQIIVCQRLFWVKKIQGKKFLSP